MKKEDGVAIFNLTELKANDDLATMIHYSNVCGSLLICLKFVSKNILSQRRMKNGKKKLEASMNMKEHFKKLLSLQIHLYLKNPKAWIKKMSDHDLESPSDTTFMVAVNHAVVFGSLVETDDFIRMTYIPEQDDDKHLGSSHPNEEENLTTLFKK